MDGVSFMLIINQRKYLEKPFLIIEKIEDGVSRTRGNSGIAFLNKVLTCWWDVVPKSLVFTKEFPHNLGVHFQSTVKRFH